MTQSSAVASRIVLWAVAGLIAACSSGTAHPVDDDGGSGSTGGSGGSNGGSVGGTVIKRDGGSTSTGGNGGAGAAEPTADANCGIKTYGLTTQPAEVMLIVDRSGSMNETLTRGGPSKWDDMEEALSETVLGTQSAVHWGLQLYPSNSSCGTAGSPSVDPGPNSFNRVDRVLKTVVPEGGTPTRVTMQNVTTFMSGRTTPNPKYLLLATDGIPNCVAGPDDSVETINAVGAAKAAGFPVFVIGVATSGSAPHATLNSMAEAGGRPRADATRYFSVNSKAELVMALGTIAGQISSCSFSLGTTPPDPNAVVVEVDGQRVPRSGTEGWDYTRNGQSIVISGSWCTRLQSGELKNANILFGCPGEIPL
jgi:hypothetical protein